MRWKESEYAKALAHLSSLFPAQLPIETQAAWRVELRDEGIDPRDVVEGVRQLGRDVDGRIYLRKLFDAARAARATRLTLEREADRQEDQKLLASRAANDPMWNEAGMRIVRRTLAGERFTEEGFAEAQRREYDRLLRKIVTEHGDEEATEEFEADATKTTR